MPVRVIRGHQSRTSYVGKVYTYDGLYKVNLIVVFHFYQAKHIFYEFLSNCSVMLVFSGR